jgi:hypothetical protein
MRDGDRKLECGTVYKQILISAKLQIGKTVKRELSGRSPLRR